MNDFEQYRHYATQIAQNLLDTGADWRRGRPLNGKGVTRAITTDVPREGDTQPAISAVAWGADMDRNYPPLRVYVSKSTPNASGYRVEAVVEMPIPLRSAEFVPAKQRMTFLDQYAAFHLARALMLYIDDTTLRERLIERFPDPRTQRELRRERWLNWLKMQIQELKRHLPSRPQNRGYK